MIFRQMAGSRLDHGSCLSALTHQRTRFSLLFPQLHLKNHEGSQEHSTARPTFTPWWCQEEGPWDGPSLPRPSLYTTWHYHRCGGWAVLTCTQSVPMVGGTVRPLGAGAGGDRQWRRARQLCGRGTLPAEVQQRGRRRCHQRKVDGEGRWSEWSGQGMGHVGDVAESE